MTNSVDEGIVQGFGVLAELASAYTVANDATGEVREVEPAPEDQFKLPPTCFDYWPLERYRKAIDRLGVGE